MMVRILSTHGLDGLVCHAHGARILCRTEDAVVSARSDGDFSPRFANAVADFFDDLDTWRRATRWQSMIPTPLLLMLIC
jgi:hypothetical protein